MVLELVRVRVLVADLLRSLVVTKKSNVVALLAVRKFSLAKSFATTLESSCGLVSESLVGKLARIALFRAK